jgi:hypothetical protein
MYKRSKKQPLILTDRSIPSHSASLYQVQAEALARWLGTSTRLVEKGQRQATDSGEWMQVWGVGRMTMMVVVVVEPDCG